MEVFKSEAYIQFISPVWRFITDPICAIVLLVALLSVTSVIGCVRQTSVSSRRRSRYKNKHRSPESPPPKVEKSIRVSMHCTADTNISESKTPTTVVGGLTRRTAMSAFANKSRDKLTARPIESSPVIVTVDTLQKAAHAERLTTTVEKTRTELTRDETNGGGTNETHKTKCTHATVDKQQKSSDEERKPKTTLVAVTCMPADIAQQAHQSILETPTAATSDGAASKSNADDRHNGALKKDRDRKRKSRSPDKNHRKREERTRTREKANGGRR